MSIEQLDGKTVKMIRVVPYSHHDHAWMCTRNWHITRYIQCYIDVLEKLKENKEFTWCIDNVVHSLIPFLKYCPDKIEEFVSYVKEGRICVTDGGYSLARPSHIGEESYIRNLMAGRKYFKETFQINDIPCLFNADTGCGHSQLPQIASLSGHKYYRFFRPDVILSRKKIPFQFRWRGLDGSEVVASRGVYGSLWSSNEFLEYDYTDRWEDVKKEFFKNWLFDKVIDTMPTEDVILFLGSDDSRPLMDASDKPLKFNEFMAEWNKREPVKMEYATVNSFFDEADKKNLPLVAGVLDHAELSYNFPIRSNLSFWRLRLELDRLIVNLEKTAVIAGSLGYPYPKKEIDDLWVDLFKITGHAIEFIQKKDNDELYLIGYEAKLRTQRLINEAGRFIANSVAKKGELQFVLINTLPWEVTQPVSFEVTSYHGVSGFDIIDLTGKQYEYQILDYQNGYICYSGSDHMGVQILINATVPPMGYTSLFAVPNGKSLKPLAEKTFIDFLPALLPDDCGDHVVFNSRKSEAVFCKGKLVSLKNLVTGALIKAEEASLSSLRFYEFSPEASWVLGFKKIAEHEFLPEHWKVLQNGPVSYVYRVYGKISNQPAQITYTLNIDSYGLDIEVETDFHDEIEGLLVFATKADTDSDFYADIPFGTEKRELFDNILAKESTGEYDLSDVELSLPGQIYGKNWCSFKSNAVPLSIVTQNCSVYYNFEKSKEQMELILTKNMPMKYRTDRWMGECPESFGGTGKNSYTFSLFLNEKVGKSSDIQRYHKEHAYPISAYNKFEPYSIGASPLGKTLLKTDQKNIICTAFYMDAGELYARFFECDGVDTKAEITLPENIISAVPVDFEGNTLNDIENSFDKEKYCINILFKKFKIITLKILLCKEG